MKKTLLLLLLVLSGCGIWEPLDVNLAKARTINPLKLEPSTELLFLRQDIIRQTYEECVDDSTTETKKVDYHPMGFDLGNGLFYDFNKNLSLRLDALLGLQGEADFTIKMISASLFGDKIDYKIKSGMDICDQWINLAGNEKRRCLTVKTVADTTMVYRDNDLYYSIKNGGGELVYLNRRGSPIKKMEQLEPGYFREEGFWSDAEYQIVNDSVRLDNDLLITLSEDGSLAEIYNKSWGRYYLNCKIIFTEQEIVIFDRRHYGSKIIKKGNRFEFYQNKQKIREMEVM